MKSFKVFFIKIIVLITPVFFIVGCKNKNDDKINSLKTIINDVLGEKLILPDSIYIYKPFTNYKTDSTKISNSKLKIYTYINASCGICIDNIKSWSDFLAELNEYRVPIILIFKSDDNFQSIQYLCESGEVDFFPYPFFFDKNNEYEKLNKFMDGIKDFETVLTDKNNNILLLGNPIRLKATKDLYLKEIKKNRR